MLFFGSRCERLCMIQFSLISLIPGLINNLQDCADPSFDNYSQNVENPTSLKTSERSSCMLPGFSVPHDADRSSACLYGAAFANIRKGYFTLYNTLYKSDLFRGVCSVPIRLCSSWTCWQTPGPSHMWSGPRTRFFCSRRTATAMY